jgi:Ca2+/Na+ antiporter
VMRARKGMTVLAWGNSIGDTVANVVVARAGFPEMAIAAAFGGPLFNTVLGVGLSVTFHNSVKGKALCVSPPTTQTGAILRWCACR